MKLLQIFELALTLRWTLALEIVAAPKPGKIDGNPYKPPAKTLEGYTPKTVEYQPKETQVCDLPGIDCTSILSALFDSASSTSDIGCATTDAACLNCGLAYESQSAALFYDPNLFSSSYEYQAAALCYQVDDTSSSSLIWAPGYYDAPYSYCYSYWSSAGYYTSAYWASYYQGFCSAMGNVLDVSSTNTDGPTIVAAQATGLSSLASSPSVASSSASVAVGPDVGNLAAWTFAVFGVTTFAAAILL
ncbi:uncharacterized protein PV09_05977 [Verruconis gallopava]|uniref:Uncharacterized protein n=1 Tax=Verruconis gallopava TaxID=253628 RepID=A0A0D1XKS6_9PEZI|nr:uncharacterized protein PV09_05977 [Verruconis gallopava]KIW02931.1 hypothetical protein PV09_05977 [Verruconis gallopava]